MEVKYIGDVAEVDGCKFRKDRKTGYYLSTKKIGNSRPRLHRYIWEKYNGNVPKGYEIHHIDSDKDNNEIENLIAMSKKEHLTYHGENVPEELVEKWKNNLEKVREKASQWHKSKEGRKWHSQMSKKAYEKRKPQAETCINCGKKYKSKKYGAVKFCNPSCQTQYRVKSGIDDEERKCVICGSRFIINKYRKTQTCSRVCSGKLNWKNRS